MASSNQLTRIQIDCNGAPTGATQATSIFAGLPIGASNGRVLAARREVATGAERQGLLTADDMQNDTQTCMGKTHRWAPCLMYVTCVITMATLIVFVVLFYVQVSSAVGSIDNAVSLKSRTVAMIRNADTILNRSAEISTLVEHLGGLSLNAAMFSQPYLTRVLNSTTNAVDDFHRLVERPVISLNG